MTVSIARSPKPWTITDRGLSFIAEWESGVLNGINFQGHLVTDGFILKAYYDNVGILTIGCGHRVLPEDHIVAGQTISLERAREFKRKDISIAQRRLNNSVHVPLFQHEYDALVSIVYNTGAGQGADTLVQRVNTGDYVATGAFLPTYRVGSNSGVRARRASEARLFTMRIYDASH
ncbi:lysozyme [Ralstonia sp. UBA689]|uniref:lysozyme n=1 Tax=Ralstonia sp. UBA689 TaxID=1947373 RepID=UPI0025D91DBD|nr:lysozyme [Ralstonia sp. UBA689]